MKDTNPLSRACRALSSKTRVQIVQRLRGRALCVGALAARLGVTQGAISQHLRILREAGLVVSDKRGTYVHYRLDETAFGALRDTVGRLLETPHQKGAKRCLMKRNKAAKSRKS